MAKREPTPPWYQFSLRSLLLLVLFGAILCSLGVCLHWLLSAAIGSAVLIGGLTGRIVAGTRLGFVQGVVFATEFVLLAGLFLPVPSLSREPSWGLGGLYAVLGIASLIGGVVGGFTVRPRSGR